MRQLPWQTVVSRLKLAPASLLDITAIYEVDGELVIQTETGELPAECYKDILFSIPSKGPDDERYLICETYVEFRILSANYVDNHAYQGWYLPDISKSINPLLN